MWSTLITRLGGRTECGRAARSRSLTLGILFFLLTANCTLPTASAAGAWQKQRTGSMAWLHSVFFLDQNRGWVVGSRGTLLVTTDGGTNWRSLVHPSEDTIRDIYFADDLNGIIVCERNIYEWTTTTIHYYE